MCPALDVPEGPKGRKHRWLPGWKEGGVWKNEEKNKKAERKEQPNRPPMGKSNNTLRAFHRVTGSLNVISYHH